MINIDNRTETIILLDYYGNLLSDKQLSAMKSYYFNDLSLTEIASNQGVSKQAISDLIIRSEKKLEEIESELRLVHKSKMIKSDIDKMMLLIEEEQNRDVVKLIYEKLKELREKI